MAGDNRGPISSWVGDIPIANSYYSGDLTKMSDEGLRARLNELLNADPDDDDTDEACVNRGNEMDAIRFELKRRQEGQKPQA